MNPTVQIGEILLVRLNGVPELVEAVSGEIGSGVVQVKDLGGSIRLVEKAQIIRRVRPAIIGEWLCR